jgi:spore coat protein H
MHCFSNARLPGLLGGAFVTLCLGCSDASTAAKPTPGSARHDAGLGGDAGRDGAADAGLPDDVVFDRSRVLEIELTIADADWDTLRREGHSINDVMSGCGKGGFAYTLVPAHARIDGMDIGTIGARKKGYIGSLSAVRPSLHLDLNTQDPAANFHGRTSLTLNNSRQDPSFTHLCMAFDVFAAAGVPSSRCGFAHVTVNGQDLGVYVDVEAVKKTFLGRYFTDPNGNLYEGTAADFRTDMLDGFEKKQNTSDPDTSDLTALSDALTKTGAAMAQAVDALVDRDEYLRFWAVESLISHWDGYDGDLNNFLVYHDPTGGKLAFIPWGPDAAFVKHHGFLPDKGRPVSVLAWARLPDRLYAFAKSRDAYRAGLSQLLASVWHEDALLAQVDAIERLLGGRADPTGLAAQRDFITSRRAEVQAELDAPAPAWLFPERSATSCTPDAISPISGSFKTTWGKLSSLTAAPGLALSVQIDGTEQQFTVLTASAGDLASASASSTPSPGPSQRGPAVRLLGVRADKSFVLLQLVLGPQPVAPGTILMHGAETLGYVVLGTNMNDAKVVGLMGEGQVVFDRAGTRDGDPVEGHFEGKLVRTSLGGANMAP